MDMMGSIFKVIHYRHVCDSKRKLRYPTFKVQGNDVAYFKTTDEVEKYIQENAVFYKAVNEYCFCNDRLDLYAYVVLEIPLGIQVNTYQTIIFRFGFICLMELCGVCNPMRISSQIG